MGTQREKIMGSEGGVLWVRLWEMKFLNIVVLAIRKICKILWVPIMPGTRILWVPDFFFDS
jgi:hypothetical protein